MATQTTVVFGGCSQHCCVLSQLLLSLLDICTLVLRVLHHTSCSHLSPISWEAAAAAPSHPTLIYHILLKIQVRVLIWLYGSHPSPVIRYHGLRESIASHVRSFSEIYSILNPYSSGELFILGWSNVQSALINTHIDRSPWFLFAWMGIHSV